MRGRGDEVVRCQKLEPDFIAWDTVRDIEARSLRKKFSKPKLKHLKQLAIDEIYLGKSVKFRTVVLDLESGAIVFVGRGKGAEALDPFWKRLAGSKAKIEAIEADMSPADALAVRKPLLKAVLVNDRFHVIKLDNEILTALLRLLHRQAYGDRSPDFFRLKLDALHQTRYALVG